MKTYEHDSLEASETTLNAILDLIVEGTWDWTAKTGHVDRSPGWYRMLGYEEGIFLKDVFTWENIIHPDDHASVMEHFESYITGQSDRYEIEYRCKKADGNYLWIRDRGKIIEKNADGSVSRMIGAHQNIHIEKMAQNELKSKHQLFHDGNLSLEKLLEEKNLELEDKNQELVKKIQEVEYLSITDALTGIANRRKFEIDIDKEITRSMRYGHDLSIIIFDIDLFKNVNDRFGHKVGDLVLKKLTSIVKGQLRFNDSISRWGGEEFALLLPETNLEEARNVAEKLRHYISEIDFDKNLFITCSFGVAQFYKDETTDTLFTKADEALYRAKAHGRNRVETA